MNFRSTATSLLICFAACPLALGAVPYDVDRGMILDGIQRTGSIDLTSGALIITTSSFGFVPENTVRQAPPEFGAAAISAALQSGKKIAAKNSRNGRAAIKAALRKPVRVDAVKTPLARVVDSLQEQAGIDILLDEESLKGEGLNDDTPVSLRVSSLPLQSALNLVLRPHHLGWIRDNGVLLIVSENFPRSLTTKTYDVADLVACRTAKGEAWDDYDTLVGVISDTVAPATWYDNGGRGSIEGATLGKAKVLVVDQSPDNQRRIAKLLAAIRTVAEKKSGGDAFPIREKPLGIGTAGRGSTDR